MIIEEIEEMLVQTESALKECKFKDAESIATKIIELLSLNNSVEISLTIPNKSSLLSRAYYYLSKSFLERGLPNDALPHANNALAIAIESNNKEKEAEALNILGIVHFNLGDFSQSLEYHKSSLTIYEELNIKQRVAISKGNIGQIYRAISDYPRAIQYLQCAYTALEELGEKSEIARIAGSFGVVYTQISDYPNALFYYNKSLSMYEELGNKKGVANAQGNLAFVYIDLGDYTRALEYCTQSYAIFEELGNKSSVAAVSNTIGNIYLKLFDYTKALDYFKFQLSIVEELDDKKAVISAYGSLGNLYSDISNFQLALEYQNKALFGYEKSGMKSEFATTLGNIGTSYFRQSDFISAMKYWQQELAIQKEVGISFLIAGVMSKIGALLAKKEFQGFDPKKAEVHFLEAISINESLGTKQNLYKCYQLLASLYEQEDETEKALYYYKKYHELYIEVQNEEVKKQADKFGWERKIADMEKEKEIEAIKTEADKKILEQTIALQTLKIEAKSREVKSNIEELVNKNNLLHQIRTDIEQVEPFTRQQGREIIEHTLNRINRNIKSFDTIGSIKQQWDEVHGKFIQQLHEANPKLTPMELKISALLKMNLTSSNITTIVFLSKRTIEFHRYNIRKKMNLPRKTNLNLLFNQMFSE